MNNDGNSNNHPLSNGFNRSSGSSNTWSGRPNRLIMPEERLQAASKTSVLNPYGGVPANTLNSAPFPMKRTSSSHQPVGTPHPKRQKINGLGNLRNPPQPVMTLLAPRHSAGPDLMRRRNTLSQMSGDEVEDAIKGRASPVTVVSDSDDEMNLRDSSKDPRKDPIAATPAFSNSIDGRVPDVRNTTNQIVGASLMPKPLHLDMRGLSRGPHYKRIHGMKSRDGASRGPALQQQPDFLGKRDELSQPSLKRKPAQRTRPLQFYELVTEKPNAVRLEIEEAFFGKEEQTDKYIGCFNMFSDAGKFHFELDLKNERFEIRERDLAWKLQDSNSKLILGISKDGTLLHDLVSHKILAAPSTLNGDFPGRILALKFGSGTFQRSEVKEFLQDLPHIGRPPEGGQFRNAGLIWQSLLTARRSKINRDLSRSLFPPKATSTSEEVVSRKNKLDKETPRPGSPHKSATKRLKSTPGLADDASFDLASPPTSPLSVRTRAPPRTRTSAQAFGLPSERSQQDDGASSQTKKRNSVSSIYNKTEGDDEIVLIYPFTGPGGVQITRGEHRRLEPSEFLNDTIIEFGLRFWMDELKERNPSLAEQIHVFSPFFYKKLRDKAGIDAGYNAVKKWTSKVDIFQKRYLVIPINERLHWYLAIIMYPEYILHQPSPTEEFDATPKAKTRAQTHTRSKSNSTTPEIVRETPFSDSASLPASRPPSPDRAPPDIDVEMRDRSPGEKDELDEPAVELLSADGRSPCSSGVVEADILNVDDESCVSVSGEPAMPITSAQGSTWLLSFDSLGGRHPSVFRTLKQYLAREAKNKKGIIIGDSVPVYEKKVPSPVQPNYCDCGVYLIKTAETFLSRPEYFFAQLLDEKDPLTVSHAMWDPGSFATKRAELYDILTALSRQWIESKKPKLVAEPVSTQSQASLVELVPPDIPEPTPQTTPAPTPKPFVEISDDDNEIEFVGVTQTIKGKGRPSKGSVRR